MIVNTNSSVLLQRVLESQKCLDSLDVASAEHRAKEVEAIQLGLRISETTHALKWSLTPEAI